YREGAFVTTGFYPRAGCGDPPLHFSVLAAGGFTPQAAIDATIAGTVPQETDPSMCTQDSPDNSLVSFKVESPVTNRDVAELACGSPDWDAAPPPWWPR